ncbi:UDP-N-acetylglucosamine--N-acetylmuramyl-(pentapeptide) pyrophosphoryl-undecaprenol N-acetylglucosamine transferase [Paenibacillus yonginensis]|uniref:UDP-N-acetylglucosamine--N-acetylmuramyl-(pentapeptide) pyrophosphoryl-undecaprenol N-acetylglucosamine transferase n=1 Tax=Paenibacillus yonginensis TaxID=1462996 RepID=A0A1B1N0W7_9BACL|nr:undecaprenyldiphospho-muramoylpentapeptide beta-N-acetylglucosaminyltransferase [Paenibacillus yonginensis]ANS75080.1 UDP-N-acetylglucosamine--N-acetylmuramyl-(pentapeptide) pyrophosphoryl-undecaprenol N-acetylglucosamine transferase [Paenibacillus yonginensis]
MKQVVVFTGGGSAGHVTANLVLISKLLQEGWEIHYIGSKNGIERRLVGELEQVRYHAVATGKLRRYWSWQNLTDIFRLILGIFQAYGLLFRIKPGVVFSLGGFVSVPVVIGAGWRNIPALILEPDLHPGLANRISVRYAQTFCTTFEETKIDNKRAAAKMKFIGPVVREDLNKGTRERGLDLCGFTAEQPVLLVMGGSQGAERINRLTRAALPGLLERFQVVHICGKGKMDLSYSYYEGYKQFEFVQQELADILAMSDVIVSRAGSGAIHECLSLHKPMLLIPHSSGGSRMGQIRNAQHFWNKGYAELLLEEKMNVPAFLRSVEKVYNNRSFYEDNMRAIDTGHAAEQILELISKAGSP